MQINAIMANQSTVSCSNCTTDISTSQIVVYRSGYDIPVYGLENGQFYYLHSAALGCILCSFICVIITFVISSRRRSYSTFFTKWTKTERFVIYMAICDGSFNISHSLDHLLMLITGTHVYPKELCETIAFNITVFITAQMLLVNIIAINVFMVIYFNKNLNFGRKDWRLLLYIFGVPSLIGITAVCTDQFGPATVTCYFDKVKGQVAVWLTTTPAIVIMLANVTLYIFTWKQIRKEALFIKTVISMSTTKNASIRTARNMSMFVAAFFGQWSSMAVYFVWGRLDPNLHSVMYFLVVTLSNLGGCLNLAVCLLIRRKRAHTTCSPKPSTSNGSMSTKISTIHSSIKQDHVNFKSSSIIRQDSGCNLQSDNLVVQLGKEEANKHI